MKRRALLSQLADCGARFVREGGAHSIYENPRTRRSLVVPRHSEISPGVSRKVIQQGCNDAERDPRWEELAAGRRVGPNTFEFDTIEEAEIFAHVLRNGRRDIRRRGRVVHVLSRVPRADIEWADANAFKYGGRRPRRERDPADPTVRMYRGYELISRYSTIHPRSHAWSARIWNPTKGRSLGPIFFFGRTEPAVLKRARQYIDQFADRIERGGQAPPERRARRTGRRD